MNKTIEQVIEEHRKRIGASKFHVTLGPNATPETLEAELNSLYERQREYYQIPLNVRLESEILQLRAVIDKISELGRSSYKEFAQESDEVRKIKSKINRLTDIIPDVHEKEAFEFHQQLKSGKKHLRYPA